MSRPRAVLVGAPGAGKSTVGRLLAQRLGVPFRDTDVDIERAAGKPISEIFFDDGEARFRELEVEAVAAALGGHHGVLSLGGGAVLSDATRQELLDHEVVWLQVGLSGAASRTGLSGHRPVLAVNPRASLRALLEDRRPLYEAVAVHRVDTDDRSVEDVVAAVLVALAP